jgi:hypothetical protein
VQKSFARQGVPILAVRRAKARNVYLPEYEKALANGERAPQHIIDRTATDIVAPANDNTVQQADELQQRADHAAPSGP